MSKLRRETVIAFAGVGVLALAACADGSSSPGAQPPALEDVQVYLLREDGDPYSRDSYVAVTRPAADESTEGRLRAALRELLKGPTPREEKQGLVSVFSEDTAGSVRDVVLADDGAAVVEFADLRRAIPQAGASEGGAVMMVQLNQTVFALPQVSSVEYRIEGSCDAFWEWQQSVCHVIDRGEWESGANPLSDDG